MSRFEYKTRGDNQIHDKPNIYYTGYSEDFDLYFEGVAKDILYNQDCVVWYDAEPTAEYEKEELCAWLDQMQLMVISITSRFLFWDNRARDFELKYAIENHIPVLPILQEDGIIEDFNNICGEIQYIERNSRELSTASYEEKLEKYLASVIVGDELAEKIRNAFDSYIFLSYRKKDRKWAQQLMKLIHQNEFCRDIAIWYDEFLVPGENFNAAIEKALLKSELFAMVITPNLVNEKNYVQEIEYPMAKEHGKPIVPVEFVETSHELLSQSYQGMPECIHVEPPEHLTQTLLRNIRKTALHERNQSSEHLLFIGLAYLNGIDVEIDYEKAVKLIKTAAGQELPEAMQQIANMCWNGIGIARDFAEAIAWQEKLVYALERKYLTGNDESVKDRYLEAVMLLGEYQLKSNHFYEASITFLNLISGNECDVDLLCDAHEKMAYALLRGGAFDLAEDAYIRLCAIAEKRTAETADEKDRRRLAVAHMGLSDVYRKKGEYSLGLEQIEKAWQIFKWIEYETKTPTAKLDLSTCLKKTGDCLGEMGGSIQDIKKRKQLYYEAIELEKGIFGKENEAVFSRNNAHTTLNLASICHAFWELSEASRLFEEGITILEDMQEKGFYCDILEDLPLAYEEFGDVCFYQGNLSLAKESYQEAELLQRDKVINADEDTALKIGRLYLKLCRICAKEQAMEEAKQYYDQGVGLITQIERLGSFEFPEQRILDEEASANVWNMAEIFGIMAECEIAQNMVKCAEKNNIRQYDILIKILPEDALSARKRCVVIDNYLIAGDIKKVKGKKEEAKEVYEQAIKMLKHLHQCCIDTGLSKDLMKFYVPRIKEINQLK